MFDIGGGELLLIFLAIVVLFGPRKIPEFARMIGKGLAQFRQAQTEFQRNINAITDEINDNVRIVEQTVQDTARDIERGVGEVSSEVASIAEDTPPREPKDYLPKTVELQDERFAAPFDTADNAGVVEQHSPEKRVSQTEMATENLDHSAENAPTFTIQPAPNAVSRTTASRL